MTQSRAPLVPVHQLAWWALMLACGGCAAPAERAPAVVEPVPVAALEAAGTDKANPKPPVALGKQVLEKGIASYQEGAYDAAARQLQTALDFGLPVPRDRATAHKYLAFISCASGREARCRDQFRKALSAMPSFELTPAESGHPAWGPVFRSVKASAG